MMGCTHSSEQSAAPHDYFTYSHTSMNQFNEVEIDLSHFTKPQRILGIGGFGMVHSVTKITGKDKGFEYAMKSMNKAEILRRSSGTLT